MKPTAHICQLKLFQHVPNITLVGGNRRNFSSSTLIRVIDHNIKTWTLTYCLTFQVSCPTSCSYHLLPECNRFSLKLYLMWAIPHSSYQSASNDSNLTTHFMWHFYAIRGSSFWPLSIAVNNARHHTRFLLDASRHHLRYLAFSTRQIYLWNHLWLRWYRQDCRLLAPVGVTVKYQVKIEFDWNITLVMTYRTNWMWWSS